MLFSDLNCGTTSHACGISLSHSQAVAEYATVFFIIENFAEYLLSAKTTSFTSKGILYIIADIMINSSSEFPDVITMIRNFHCAKVVMHSIGKFLQGSGAKETLIECKVFGIKAAESVMNRTHVRSLKG